MENPMKWTIRGTSVLGTSIYIYIMWINVDLNMHNVSAWWLTVVFLYLSGQKMEEIHCSTAPFSAQTVQQYDFLSKKGIFESWTSSLWGKVYVSGEWTISDHLKWPVGLRAVIPVNNAPVRSLSFGWWLDGLGGRRLTFTTQISG